MMRIIDPNFVQFDLKIDKTDMTTAMAGSVLKTNEAMSEAQGGEKVDGHQDNRDRKKQGRGGRADQDVFFTLNERDFKGLVKPASSIADQ